MVELEKLLFLSAIDWENQKFDRIKGNNMASEQEIRNLIKGLSITSIRFV